LEFCPTCEALLKKKNNELVCPKCEYVKKIGKTVKEKPGESDPDFLVMGESDMIKDQTDVKELRFSFKDAINNPVSRTVNMKVMRLIT